MLKKFADGKKSVYIISAVLAFAVSLFIMAVFAAVIYLLNIDRKYIPTFSTVSVAIGCMAASFFAARKICEKGYLIGLIIGSVCFCLITVLSLIMGSGGISLNSLFHFVTVVLSSIVGGIMGVNKGGGKII